MPGRKIKEIRKKVGITQSSIASWLGIDRSAIAKWETGKAEPKVQQIPKIAEFLGCEIADLFENKKETASAVSDTLESNKA